MQSGIEGYFPPKIIPHILSRCVLSYQASSSRLLFIAERTNAGEPIKWYLTLFDKLLDAEYAPAKIVAV